MVKERWSRSLKTFLNNIKQSVNTKIVAEQLKYWYVEIICTIIATLYAYWYVENDNGF